MVAVMTTKEAESCSKKLSMLHFRVSAYNLLPFLLPFADNPPKIPQNLETYLFLQKDYEIALKANGLLEVEWRWSLLRKISI